jgi:hypothetical protein
VIPHSNASGALEVVKLATMGKLCAWEDGCWCTGCQVHGVDIDITCHKSTGSDVDKAFPGHWGAVLRITESRADSPDEDVRGLAQAICADLLGGEEWCYYSQIAVEIHGADDSKPRERRELWFVARRIEHQDRTEVVFLPPDQARLPEASEA